jgi:hypothetical protein
MKQKIHLIVSGSKYHRKCSSHYFSDRNLKAAHSKVNCSDKITTPHQIAFQRIAEELEQLIISNPSTLTTLTDLLTKMIAILQDIKSDSAESYTTWKLKEKLKLTFKRGLLAMKEPGNQT